MSIQQIDTDAMRKLIEITQRYQEAIKRDKWVLLNAAALCDQAMGSDPIISKKIARLEDALRALDMATNGIISSAQEEIRRDLQDLERIVEEA